MKHQKAVDLMTEIAHEQSMSDDPRNACYGRMLKHIIPVQQAILMEEFERETDPGVIMLVMLRISAHLSSTTSYAIADTTDSMPKEVQNELIKNLVMFMKKAFDRAEDDA